MKYTLKIFNLRDVVYYVRGTTEADACLFSCYLYKWDVHFQFKRDEYFKSWKVLRYQMRIDSLKRKIFEANK